MLNENDYGNLEYTALMERSRTIERTGITTWTIATTASVIMLGWAIADNSPGRMLGVVLAAAAGLYPLIYARQQVRLIAGYVREFVEGRSSSLQWHTRLGHLEVVPALNPANDWILTAISNLTVIGAVILSWMFAGPVHYGNVLAGFVTALGVMFSFHSVMETARVAQTDFAAVWRKVSSGPRETEYPRDRAAS